MAKPSVEALKGPQGPPLRPLNELENYMDIDTAASENPQPGKSDFIAGQMNNTEYITDSSTYDATQYNEHHTSAGGKPNFLLRLKNHLGKITNIHNLQ